MRILLDTNIVLDFLLEREPFLQDADRVFQAIENNQIIGYISETLTVTVICPVDRAILEAAFALGLTDFEDAVQIACAIAQELDGILTRDRQGFTRSPVPAFSVEDLLQRLNRED